MTVLSKQFPLEHTLRILCFLYSLILFHFKVTLPAVINDAGVTQIVRIAAVSVVDGENTLLTEPSMGEGRRFFTLSKSDT